MPIAIASLAVIAHGALTQLIASARLVHDIGRDEAGAPKFLGHVNTRTQTPVLATLIISAVVIAIALFVPLKQLAIITSYAILLVFVGVNASLMDMKRRSQPVEVPDI